MKINIKNISALLLDLGGVILDIDPERSLTAFKEIGFKDAEGQLKQFLHMGIFSQLERGEISPISFRSAIKKGCQKETMINGGLSDAMIDKAWGAMLLGVPGERMEALFRVHEYMPLFLLSNTNAIHQNMFEPMLTAHYPLMEIFEDIFYSHHIGFSKPDPNAFLYAIENIGVPAEEILFIDDSEANIQMASELGMVAVHLKPEEELVDKLMELGFKA